MNQNPVGGDSSYGLQVPQTSSGKRYNEEQIPSTSAVQQQKQQQQQQHQLQRQQQSDYDTEMKPVQMGCQRGSDSSWQMHSIKTDGSRVALNAAVDNDQDVRMEDVSC